MPIIGRSALRSACSARSARSVLPFCDVLNLDVLPVLLFCPFCKIIERGKLMEDNIYCDFCNDEEKMADFWILTKEEFLLSYSYLTEEEYDLTVSHIKNSFERV